MSERRIDKGGRDVTDLPGLWSDEDKVIPAKPEAMEIDGHRVSLDNGFMRIGSLFSHYYFSSRTEAIRKLGEWCIAVADWREAQGDSE
jgi:hypothetical protein